MELETDGTSMYSPVGWALNNDKRLIYYRESWGRHPVELRGVQLIEL